MKNRSHSEYPTPHSTPPSHMQVDRRTAAKMLDYPQRTFDRLVARGLIRPNRATSRPRFAITELQRFVAEGGRPL